MFTIGSHSEVIPSHGKNYVGHQKVFHCCPAGAAAAHGAQSKGKGTAKIPVTPHAAASAGPISLRCISAEQVKKGQQPESCKAVTQEMKRERECYVRAGRSQPHLFRHQKANKKQTKSKQNTHPSPAPNSPTAHAVTETLCVPHVPPSPIYQLCMSLICTAQATGNTFTTFYFQHPVAVS